jgi:hypothetical protein
MFARNISFSGAENSHLIQSILVLREESASTYHYVTKLSANTF